MESLFRHRSRNQVNEVDGVSASPRGGNVVPMRRRASRAMSHHAFGLGDGEGI